jgi:hypothetical protein
MKPNMKRIAKDTPALIPQHEVAAIEHVLAFGEQYGFGNLMSWLATGWCLKQPHMRKAGTIKVTPYPKGWLLP